MLRNQKGFTLVELMVVVIIVLVLAGIAVPVYMHYLQESKKAEAYAVIDSIVNGALVYFQKNGTFAGGSITKFMAKDDVDNAQYFSYYVDDMSSRGFRVRAIEKGNWAPDGARIEWQHSGADASRGDPGNGSFKEYGW